MTTEKQLLDLAERVEKASEGSFKLDDAIYEMLFCGEGVMFTPFAEFSRSLDAAMSLLPEGWRTAAVSEHEHKEGWFWRLGRKIGTARFGRPGVDGDAATPALALTAACLRARAAMEATNG